MVEGVATRREDASYRGIFDTPPFFLGADMKCPSCGENTPGDWSDFWIPGHPGYKTEMSVKGPESRFKGVAARFTARWKYCANPECAELVVVLNEAIRVGPSDAPQDKNTTWYGRPRAASRLIDPLIREPYRRDYVEAAAVLNVSPRMSAVLSRRILGDLLEEFAGRKEYGLNDRIENYVKDTGQPSGIRENLHYLREMGDFSAHTQKTDQAEVIDVDRDEAEWTLDIIDRLFDHYIIGPERDRRMREGMDKKVEAAQNRRPIPPLPTGEDDS